MLGCSQVVQPGMLIMEKRNQTVQSNETKTVAFTFRCLQSQQPTAKEQDVNESVNPGIPQCQSNKGFMTCQSG
jgi:hypothetical protein